MGSFNKKRADQNAEAVLMLILAVFTFSGLDLKAECRRTSFRSTSRDLFVTNDQNLRLTHTLHVSHSAQCIKGCLDYGEKSGKNLQVFHARNGFCGCFLSDVEILKQFSDTQALVHSEISYHRKWNKSTNSFPLFMTTFVSFQVDLHPRQSDQSE